jgi:rhamnosyltransferase
VVLASVVIITKDQRPFLARSLRALERQRSVTCEVIVVDSGSTDGAQDVVRAHGARLIELPPTRAPFRYGAAYNAGCAAAHGRFLVRLSGDAVPAGDGWLASLLAPLMADETVAATWGRQVLPRGLKNPLERLADRLYFDPRRHGREPVRYETPHCVFGAAMALPRRLWEAHPFSETLPQAEDYEWLRYWQRRGRAGVYVPRAAVVHGHDEPLGRAVRRALTQSVLQGLIVAGVADRVYRSA